MEKLWSLDGSYVHGYMTTTYAFLANLDTSPFSMLPRLNNKEHDPAT